VTTSPESSPTLNQILHVASCNVVFAFLYRNTTLQMKINIFPFSNCSPNNLRISFGDSFYADPDRLSEKESGEGGKFLYHQA
jgi:hypothetical protein